MANKLWSRDELILAFNLYLKLPFGKMHSRNNEIIHLANIIGRTASSVAIRLTNFASADPYHQNRGIVGMKGGLKQVQPIWDEFFHNNEALIFESERILAEKEKKTIEVKYKELLTDITYLKGETKLREVKTRVNQSFFRKLIMASYDFTCCITGIKQPELLIASHIKSWSIDEANRMNPCNGISINALHDKAFENGFLTITPDYHIKISSIFLNQKNNKFVDEYFNKYQNKKINLPNRYLPDKELLKYHNSERFKP
jgi:putative restriction endonuclease